MKVVVHHGVVWVYEVSGGWFRHLKGFPEALTKKGEPDPDHESVRKYMEKN